MVELIKAIETGAQASAVIGVCAAVVGVAWAIVYLITHTD
jgi:hypothetical protein